LLIKIKNKKQNKFIISERLYIGITDTINGFRSTLACCEVSDFYESQGPPPLGDVHGIVPAHRHGHQNGQHSGHILHLYFVCCHPGGRQSDMDYF
jgi:hypothetical protein